MHANKAEPGKPIGIYSYYGKSSPLTPYPREISTMEMTGQHFVAIRCSDVPSIPDDFLSGKKILTVFKRMKVKISFDQGCLTNAYPVLRFSQGIKSIIKLTYAESLFNDILEKGNRNNIKNKKT